MILIVIIIYLIIGVMIVECTKNIDEEYKDLVTENSLLYLKDMIMWLPDIVSFILEDENKIK